MARQMSTFKLQDKSCTFKLQGKSVRLNGKRNMYV